MLGAEHLARLLLLMVDERDQVLNSRHRGPEQEASMQASLIYAGRWTVAEMQKD